MVVLVWHGWLPAVVLGQAAGLRCCGTVDVVGLVRVVLLVCPGVLRVAWCGVAGPGSRPGCRTLLAGALTDPLSCLGLLAVVGVGGG